VSALRFFVRPKIYCQACGGCCEQKLDQIRHDVREIMCLQPDCPQFKRSATIVDQSLLLMEQPSDFVIDSHGNH